MVGTVFVALPVQTYFLGAEDLSAVHSHVVDSGLGVLGNYEWKCDEWASVLRPSRRNRKFREVWIGHPHLLTGTFAHGFGRHRCALFQQADALPRRLENRADIWFHQLDHALADFPRLLNAERLIGSLAGSEEIHRQRKFADRTIRKLRLLEQHCRPASLDQFVCDTARLEVAVHRRIHPAQLAISLQRLEISS